MDRGWATVHGVTKNWTQLSDWAHIHRVHWKSEAKRKQTKKTQPWNTRINYFGKDRMVTKLLEEWGKNNKRVACTTAVSSLICWWILSMIFYTVFSVSAPLIFSCVKRQHLSSILLCFPLEYPGGRWLGGREGATAEIGSLDLLASLLQVLLWTQ